MEFEEVFDYCMNKAWSDATYHVRMHPGHEIIRNKEKIIKHFKMSVFNENFAKDYDSWHESLCQSSKYGMNYGVWQKLINMTFKYLYCFKNVPMSKFPDVQWHDMHCPIDSKIAICILCLMEHQNIQIGFEIIKSISKNGSDQIGVNWNNIEHENYRLVQDIIRKLCDKHSGPIPSKLYFDFIYWNRKE